MNNTRGHAFGDERKLSRVELGVFDCSLSSKTSIQKDNEEQQAEKN